MPDRFVDLVQLQQKHIKTVRAQRDRERLRTMVARGKLEETRRRICGHSEARCLHLLDDISSEPSSLESEETDGSGSSDGDQGTSAGMFSHSEEGDAVGDQLSRDMCGSPGETSPPERSYPGLEQITWGEADILRCVSKQHALVLMSARLRAAQFK